MCDAIQSVLSNIGLLYLDPSVWQMLRGSILIFTAIIEIVYRHRRLICVDWIGIATTVTGLVIVGVSAMYEERDVMSDSSNLLLGMGLVLLSQAFQGMMTVLEAELLTDVEAHPFEITAFEGFWGLWICSTVILPFANILPEKAGEGIYENSLESFKMGFSSVKVGLLLLGYIIAVTTYNQAAIMVTKLTTAIHRTIYEVLRSIAVWVMSVLLDYAWPDSGAGEQLGWMSFARAGGFLVMFLGSLIYNRLIRIPGLYNPIDPVTDVLQAPIIAAGDEPDFSQSSLSQGSLMRYPQQYAH
jgi:hypothetical protein